MKTMSLETFMAFYGAFWVLLTVCGNVLDDYVADPFWNEVWLALLGIWLLFVLASLVHIPISHKLRRWACLLPLGYAILTVILMSCAMYFQIANRLEFGLKRRSFERVVQMVERGELQTNRAGRIRLPKEWRHLSRIENRNFNRFEGEIIARKHGGHWTIFFATQGGGAAVDGFAYRANATKPVGLESNMSVVFQPASNWFFCSRDDWD